jgi:hypothetical protein
MATDHFKSLLGVNDLKMRLLLTDPPSGSATYGAWVDVRDALTMSVEGKVDVKTRRGDGRIREQRLVITGMTAKVEHSVVDLDVRALLEGTAVTDSGTGSTSKAKYVIGGNPTFPAVQVEGQMVAPDGTDVHLSMYKASLLNFIPFSLSDADFETISYELGAVARESDGNYGEIVFNAVATAIA